MPIPPSRVGRPRIGVAVRIVVVLAVGAFWLPLVAAQDPPAREHLALDLRTPLEKLSDLSLYGPNVETMARNDDQGLHFTVLAGRKNVDVLGVEWTRRLRGDFDVSVGYELISVGTPLPRYGAGVTLRLWYDTPVTLSTALTRSKRPEGDRFVAQRIRKEGDGKEQYLNTKFATPTGPRGRLRMVRVGSRLRFLVAEGGDYREVQSIDIGTADVSKIQIFCTTHYTPIALEARFSDLDLHADQILSSWVEPAPRPGQARLAFDLRKPVEELSPLSLFGPVAESTVRSDAKGLRLILPAGREDTNPVGLELTKRLSGDFDVSFGYELLAVGAPLHRYGVALELKLWFDLPEPLSALLVRTRRTYGDRFIPFRVRTGPDGKDAYLAGKEVPAARPQGKLRLVRTGSRLHYLTSEGGDYRELQSLEIGTADVWRVRAQAITVSTPILLDTRFTEFNVQADRIQDSVKHADSEPFSPGEELALSKGSLPVLLFGGLAITLALLGVGAWFFLRHRLGVSRSAGLVERDSSTKQIPGTISFACEGCRRAMRARPEFVGKRVKCPACGNTIVVPCQSTEVLP